MKKKTSYYCNNHACYSKHCIVTNEVRRARWPSDIADKTTRVLSASTVIMGVPRMPEQEIDAVLERGEECSDWG